MTPQEKLAAVVAEMRDGVKSAHPENPIGLLVKSWADRIEQASEQGEVVVTTDASGRCVAVTRQDGEGRILSVIWEASEHGGSQAVAWMTDEPSVCGNKITTESQVADGWRANGWNVWPL